MLKKAVILLFILPAWLYSQEQNLGNQTEDNIQEREKAGASDNPADGLFEDAEDIEGEEDKGSGTDLILPGKRKKGFDISGNFSLQSGYTTGWGSANDIEVPAFLIMKSLIALDARVNDDFRFYQSFKTSYPEFQPEVKELFTDFDLAERLFFRVGRQNLTWGISRYYGFANLPGRAPDVFPYQHTFSAYKPEDSIAVKIDIPLGVGGFQGLIYGRNGFFEDVSAPKVNEMGAGAYYNYAADFLDLTIGGFYHQAMNTRYFYSAKTTLLDRLEVYSEGVLAYDHQQDDQEENDSSPMDYGLNIGFFMDYFSGMLELSGEYYRNGEETELKIVGTPLEYPLVWGHNLAGGISLKLLEKRLRMQMYALYNINENSGFLMPSSSYKLNSNMEIRFAAPVITGDGNGTYIKDLPDFITNRYNIIISLKVSGGI